MHPVQIRLLQFHTGWLSTDNHQTTPTSTELGSQLILKSRRAEGAKHLLKQLHWLPIEQRIKYKTVCFCYQIITGTSPQYLAELVQIYVPSRSLRSSSDDRTFRIPIFQENSMVIVPFASLLHKSGIVFLSLSVTALPALPSK